MPDLPLPPPALLNAIGRAWGVVSRLRGDGGCPWDRAQTRESLRPYILEEAYEVLDALDRGDPARVRDELGDLLFQVVLHAQLGAERGEFDLARVAGGLADKLVRRHPHVFGDEEGGGGRTDEVASLGRSFSSPGKARTAAEVESRWEEHKRGEREAAAGGGAGAGPGSVLAGVPAALPALARAQKLQERAARVGFDWPGGARHEGGVGEEASLPPPGVLAKLDEERAELGRALESGDPRAIEHEIGDLLFTAVNLARHARVNSEDALRVAASRFAARFMHIEEAARRSRRSLADLSLEEMDRLWDEAKSLLR